ncbi:MAG: hypothetical protein IJY01_00535 [Clostridia bacterium]|nr:hypothetical protein [Clostridia bacterium]
MSKRLVDADKLAKTYMLKGKDKLRLATVINELEIASTVDAVEVIRCKDCAHCNYDPNAEIYKCERRCIPERVSEVDFCSHGERRCEE